VSVPAAWAVDVSVEAAVAVLVVAVAVATESELEDVALGSAEEQPIAASASKHSVDRMSTTLLQDPGTIPATAKMRQYREAVEW
jgi:hypothetical protein